MLKSQYAYLVFILLIMLVASSCSRTPLHEKDYQNWWCKKHNGTTEYRLTDTTRVDCLTPQYAVEVEYAHKWAEAIGQALYYAKSTGRKPGILMIIQNKNDERFLKRIKTVAKEQEIKIWTIQPKNLE